MDRTEIMLDAALLSSVERAKRCKRYWPQATAEECREFAESYWLKWVRASGAAGDNRSYRNIGFFHEALWDFGTVVKNWNAGENQHDG